MLLLLIVYIIYIKICLLSKCVAEAFLAATEEKPWLWVVAIACVFVPIVLLIYFCTGSSAVCRFVSSLFQFLFHIVLKFFLI